MRQNHSPGGATAAAFFVGVISLKFIYNHSIPPCPIFYILILNDNFNIRTLRN